MTARAWLPLVIEGFRALGLAAAVREHAHFKQRLRGYPEAVCVETLRAFLGRFHEDAGERARGPHTAHIPADSAGLKGLDAVHEQLLRALPARVKQTHATLDVDATVIASDKRTALPLYEGSTGYPPGIRTPEPRWLAPVPLRS